MQGDRGPTLYWFGLLASAVLLLAGCGSEPLSSRGGPKVSPAEGRARIERLLPLRISDRAGWATDLYAGLAVQGVEVTDEHVCAVIAVIDQESSFQVNPTVPGLGAAARKEIERRAESAGVPALVMQGLLRLTSAKGRSYADRIDAAKTEKELSDIYDDFIGQVPLGHALLAGRNPVRTRGPMQVNIAFAERHAASRPYPYPIKSSLADELFTRRGSLYFGIAHLEGYVAPYNRYLFRFADFNAGQYASRNAAFQVALTAVSGVALVPDGDLLKGDGSSPEESDTERLVRAFAGTRDFSPAAIRAALEKGKSREFEETALYKRVFELADQGNNGSAARGVVPRIQLHGPKISRPLTTEWYANRVNARFQQCLSK